MNNILVIAVHPDDESLGCGGTLLKHKAAGDAVYWLIVTAMKTEQGFEQRAIESRRAEIEKVSSLYGFDKVYELDFPTTLLDTLPLNSIIGGISNVIEDVKPDVVYLPFYGDVHTDHQVVFKAACSCTKSFRHPSIRKIVMMETLSETEFAVGTAEHGFVPNMFVDITDFIERKIEIMKVYRNEMGVHPFPRSEENIRALATYRGATSGCKYSEGFMILKEIN